MGLFALGPSYNTDSASNGEIADMRSKNIRFLVVIFDCCSETTSANRSLHLL